MFQSKYEAHIIYSMYIWEDADPPGPGRWVLSATSWKAVW